MDKYYCPNCSYLLAEQDLFCSNCGQKKLKNDYKLKDLLLSFFEDYFSFDNKILVSLKTLFRSPGKLTKAFFEGKRSSYVLPLRLYLFVAFISIASMSVMNSKTSDEELFKISINGAEEEAASTLDSELEEVSEGRNLGQEIGRDLSHLVKHQGSIFVLLELPLFALIIFLFYYKKSRYYMESFVMALHLQTFLFISLSLGTLIEVTLLKDYGLYIGVLSYILYSVLALKNYYKTKYFSTVFKFLIIQFLQISLLILIMIIYVVILGLSRGMF